MSNFVDAWSGYELGYPEGWRVIYPPITGVAFQAPDQLALLEFSQVKADKAMQVIQQRLALNPQSTARCLEDTPQQAAIVFYDAETQGQMHCRCEQGKAVLLLAQTSTNNKLDLTQLLRSTLCSLKPLQAVKRQVWHDPLENSAHILYPQGWQVDSAFTTNNFGFREPAYRISLNPYTFLHIENNFQGFNQLPPQSPFDTYLPFQGLFPVLEGCYLRQWGARVLAFDSFSEHKLATARLQLPDGLIRVVSMEACVVPRAPRWVGGITHYYQAAADKIDQLESIFRGIKRDFQIDPQWQQLEQRRQQQQVQLQEQQTAQGWTNLFQKNHQQNMQNIQHQGQVNTAIHQTRMEISDMQFNSFQNHMHSMDITQHNTINTIRETADYLDTSSGQVHNLSSHYKQVWQDGQDNLIASDWEIQQAPTDWQQLKRLDPGDYRPPG